MLDRPGSIQSIVLAGQVATPKSDLDDIAIRTMNTILGGSFTSRVNLNLREEKHWSYGARTLLYSTRGQGPFIAYAPVQTDKTKESMIEFDKELHAILGPRPITEEELVTAQKNQTLSLPGRWETIDAVGGSLGQIVSFGLPEDYFQTYPNKVRALTVEDLTKAAKRWCIRINWSGSSWGPRQNRGPHPRARLGRAPPARCRRQSAAVRLP